MMKLSDFQKHIDLYGADLSCWPAHEIRPAVDLIQHDPAAGKILSAAEKFDQMLRHYPPVPVNISSLSARIMRQVKHQAKHAPARARRAAALNPAYLYVPGGGLLVAAILGFMIGFHTTVKENFSLDPALYTQDQVINDSVEAS